MIYRMFHVCSSVYYCCIISTLLHVIMIVNQIFIYITDSENWWKKFFRVTSARSCSRASIPPAPLLWVLYVILPIRYNKVALMSYVIMRNNYTFWIFLICILVNMLIIRWINVRPLLFSPSYFFSIVPPLFWGIFVYIGAWFFEHRGDIQKWFACIVVVLCAAGGHSLGCFHVLVV